jgi:hypothetical protein
MRLVKLVSLAWPFAALVGCGSIKLESDAHDAEATAANSEGGHGGAHDAAATASAPPPAATASAPPPAATVSAPPAAVPAAPPGCGKMCPSGNADGSGMAKHGGDHACAKPPCVPDDPG